MDIVVAPPQGEREAVSSNALPSNPISGLRPGQEAITHMFGMLAFVRQIPPNEVMARVRCGGRHGEKIGCVESIHDARCDSRCSKGETCQTVLAANAWKTVFNNTFQRRRKKKVTRTYEASGQIYDDFITYKRHF